MVDSVRTTPNNKPNKSNPFTALVKRALGMFALFHHEDNFPKQTSTNERNRFAPPKNDSPEPQKGRWIVDGEKIINGEREFNAKYDDDALTMSDDLANLLNTPDFKDLVKAHRPDKIRE